MNSVLIMVYFITILFVVGGLVALVIRELAKAYLFEQDKIKVKIKLGR